MDCQIHRIYYPPLMIGTVVNAAGILAGSIAGSIRRKPLSPPQEAFWKVTLGVFTVFYGLRLTWISLNGSPTQVSKQLVLVIVSLFFGRWTGYVLRLQKMSNRLGQYARDRMNAVAEGERPDPGDGFKVCGALFCAAPLGILGAFQDGVSGYFYPLIVKAIMDGLAVMGLVKILGKSVGLAALPVFVVQGSISIVCMQWAGPFLREKGLADAVAATNGLLIFSVALVILQLKRIPLADYLPALVYAGVIKSFVK